MEDEKSESDIDMEALEFMNELEGTGGDNNE